MLVAGAFAPLRCDFIVLWTPGSLLTRECLCIEIGYLELASACAFEADNMYNRMWSKYCQCFGKEHLFALYS